MTVRSVIKELLNLQAVKRGEGKSRPFVVLVGGLSRSGKSHLCQRCSQMLSDLGLRSLVIPIDHWIKPLSERSEASTVLDRYDIERFCDDLQKLLEGDQVILFPYDPLTRELSKHSIIINLGASLDFLILEGVVALLVDKLRSCADYAIYMKCRNLTRLKRLILFYRNSKNVSPVLYRRIIRDRELEEVPTVTMSSMFADRIIWGHQITCVSQSWRESNYD